MRATNDSMIADALVITFTTGVSLADWQAAGVLEREWALYARVGRCFRRIVLVTWGGNEDVEIGRGLRFAAGSATELVVVPQGANDSARSAEVPGSTKVREALQDCRTVVIKTNQMLGGGVAVALAAALRDERRTTALIARGGYPFSRFAAWEHGPASRQARTAAAEEGELCRAADLVVGTTPEMIDDLAWRYELSPERCATVPNYVDPPERTSGLRGSLALRAESNITRPAPTTPATILFAGRLERQKRIDRLIEGIALLPPELRSRIQLSIIGDGSQRESLRQLGTSPTGTSATGASAFRAESSAAINITFEPRIPHAQLMERMARCTIYAQTSDYEGHPKTVLEAMGVGAPVLVCDAPGCPVENRVTGLRVAPRADAVAAGLALLLTDQALAERLGRAAAAHVREHFALDRIAAAEVDVYRRALERGTQRAQKGAQSGAQQRKAEGPESVPDARTDVDVHFTPLLLAADVDQAVAAWVRPLRGFARRLPVRKRAEFLMALDTPIYHLQGETAVEADGGLHPKHRLMRYHDFFIERVRRGERILDLGCGVGALAAAIAEGTSGSGSSAPRAEMRTPSPCPNPTPIVGIDLSPLMLTRARARAAERGLADRIEYIEGDITELRAPGRFDVVVLSNVLEHITRRPEHLRMWRAWYGEPRFLIRVPAFDREWRTPWKKELGVEWRLDPTHETEYTQAQLEGELREAGLRVHECIIRWGEYWVRAEPA